MSDRDTTSDEITTRIIRVHWRPFAVQFPRTTKITDDGPSRAVRIVNRRGGAVIRWIAWLYDPTFRTTRQKPPRRTRSSRRKTPAARLKVCRSSMVFVVFVSFVVANMRVTFPYNAKVSDRCPAARSRYANQRSCFTQHRNGEAGHRLARPSGCYAFLSPLAKEATAPPPDAPTTTRCSANISQPSLRA
jgi:hypothetical protein